jgi:DNA-directed RNA polymerase subunit H (RpoH/RPB5)
MEDKALETLRTILERRKLDTKTERVVTDKLENVNLFTIGNILVIFSQKAKGLVERDINNLLAFAEANGFKNGIIIVALSAPSENVLRVVKSHSKEGVQFFHIRQLQFDITTHRLWIPHYIWNDEARAKFPDAAREYDRMKIKNPEKDLPVIDSQDPPVRYIGAVPGDTVFIMRHSDVAAQCPYWRFCVEDVNVA